MWPHPTCSSFWVFASCVFLFGVVFSRTCFTFACPSRLVFYASFGLCNECIRCHVFLCCLYCLLLSSPQYTEIEDVYVDVRGKMPECLCFFLVGVLLAAVYRFFLVFARRKRKGLIFSAVDPCVDFFQNISFCLFMWKGNAFPIETKKTSDLGIGREKTMKKTTDIRDVRKQKEGSAACMRPLTL